MNRFVFIVKNSSYSQLQDTVNAAIDW